MHVESTSHLELTTNGPKGNVTSISRQLLRQIRLYCAGGLGATALIMEHSSQPLFVYAYLAGIFGNGLCLGQNYTVCNGEHLLHHCSAWGGQDQRIVVNPTVNEEYPVLVASILTCSVVPLYLVNNSAVLQ